MTTLYAPRRKSSTVVVKNGMTCVQIGGAAPVCVQSMTNTPTEEVDATVEQVKTLARAGSELVRLTVNTPEAARGVVLVREKLDAMGVGVPLVGDFHYNGHKLLAECAECAQALSKYRINPGNVGKGDKHEENFRTMVDLACRYDKPVRIGVNGGSIDKELLARKMDENRVSAVPKSVHAVWLEAVVESAVESALAAESLGLSRNKIVLSAKVSDVPDLIWTYRALAGRGDWALHLGLTEAGIGSKGIVASTAALSVLLAEGIGDTIRISITPTPGGAREAEVIVAQELLQSMGLRAFLPMVTSCPGCGRTSSTYFETLAHRTQEYLRSKSPEWRISAPGSVSLRVAVMGCMNGPGESAGADIGISLPGRGEQPVAPVYVDGQKVASLKGEHLADEFLAMIDAYVMRRWGVGATSPSTADAK